MGRKSNTKAKERKLKHKEELSHLSSKLALIDAANSLDDPLAMLQPFKKFERNSLNVAITCQRVVTMKEDICEWVFNLTKENMEELYNSCGWGWNDRQKKEEMRDEKAWYLIAKEVSTGKPVALVHFRFDLDYGDEVVYCYEIQLVQEVRGKGLGKFLMQILELLAHKTGMKKVILTVFKQNLTSQNFFRAKLKYEIDGSSPENTAYDILSKRIQQKQVTSPTPGACHSCCGHHH